MTTLTYFGAEPDGSDPSAFFERAFFNPFSGLDILEVVEASATELVLSNPPTGYTTTITGTGFAFSGTPGNEVPVAGTVTGISFEYDSFDIDTTQTVAELTNLSWDIVEFFDALDAIYANEDFSLLADLFNGGGPITLDGSQAVDEFRLNDIFGEIQPLLTEDITVIGGPAYDVLVGGLGNDTIVTGRNIEEPFGGQIIATEGNDTIDFSNAGPTDGPWVTYSTRVDGAFTFNLNAESNQSTVVGQTFTDTFIDLRNLVLADGIGIGSGDGNDVFNVTNADGGFINILGAEGADQYNISLNGGLVRLSFRDGSDAFDLSFEAAPQSLVADLSQGMIFNDGFGNAETINILDGTGTLEIQGTNNNDNVIGSDLDESFITQQGNDTIDGGAGNDRIRYDRFGVDAVNVNLATGTAVVTYVARIFDEVTFEEEEVFSTFIDKLASIESVRGSRQGDDTLISANGIDALLDGRGGDDTLLGDAGSDMLNGGVGNDSISGGTEADTINAGAGSDTVRGDNGQDLVYLNQGNDLFQDNGQGGIFGRDTVFAGGGNDTIQGGNGDDAFYGGDGNDLINGRLGNDTIFGGTGADTLNGGDGDDTVDGGNGQDQVLLGRGNDLFIDNTQGDIFGRDTVFAGGGNDTIEGGGGNDVFHGEDGNDLINGRRGDDLIRGGTGADTINAGDGNDTVAGGNGQDRVLLGRDDDLFTDNTQGGTFGRDTVFAGAGNDTIQGGGGDDRFFGENGNDLVNGGLGNDTLGGGNGSDTLNGGAGSDTLTGAAGADTFVFDATDAVDGTDLVTDFALGIDVIEMAGTTAGAMSVGYDSEANEITVSIGSTDVAVLRSGTDLSGFGVDDIVFV
ncbi:calcium-binding protein [uncultured Tateyamaria sp.]|uniref:calcium-binding protein n=1 Tax=uncultured Tateyamaria sp. TaxID=455651 RepID=UPI002609D4C9|nr:calcium-binding protein [uncultured Tateyamaria sp.]